MLQTCYLVVSTAAALFAGGFAGPVKLQDIGATQSPIEDGRADLMGSRLSQAEDENTALRRQLNEAAAKLDSANVNAGVSRTLSTYYNDRSKFHKTELGKCEADRRLAANRFIKAHTRAKNKQTKLVVCNSDKDRLSDELKSCENQNAVLVTESGKKIYSAEKKGGQRR